MAKGSSKNVLSGDCIIEKVKNLKKVIQTLKYFGVLRGYLNFFVQQIICYVPPENSLPELVE